MTALTMPKTSSTVYLRRRFIVSYGEATKIATALLGEQLGKVHVGLRDC